MIFKNCKHDYVILKSFEIESPIEKLVRKGLSSAETVTPDMYQSKLVIVYKCSECNKIKESVHKNP